MKRKYLTAEEYESLFPGRIAEARSLESAWPVVGGHLRANLIEDFYSSLMAGGEPHERAMAMARLAAGAPASSDPRTILPIGPYNRRVLLDHGVEPPGPKPVSPVVLALRDLEAGREPRNFMHDDPQVNAFVERRRANPLPPPPPPPPVPPRVTAAPPLPSGRPRARVVMAGSRMPQLIGALLAAAGGVTGGLLQNGQEQMEATA